MLTAISSEAVSSKIGIKKTLVAGAVMLAMMGFGQTLSAYQAELADVPDEQKSSW
jgi:hypothetical protein